MTEFIIPARHVGADGYFVCAAIAGLDRDEYSRLDLSIDGENYIETRPDPNDPSRSLPVAFPVDSPGVLYEVTGRAIANGIAASMETRMCSVTTPDDDAPDDPETPRAAGGGSTFALAPDEGGM